MTRVVVGLAVTVPLGASAARAQLPDTTLGLRSLGLKRDTLRAGPAPPFVPAGGAATAAPEIVAQRWAAAVRQHIAFRAAARWRAAWSGVADTVPIAALPPAPPPEVPDVPVNRITLLSQYADLGLYMNASIELRFDRLRNLRCTAADVTRLDAACRGGFSPPRIEPQFTVRTGGVVGQRVHLNVDYDTQREFEASNNIQVYYQGLEDEIIRRAQVGNVSFNAPNSRFITGGIPANNFGAQLEGQVGAVDFGAIFAQQKGNVVRGRVFSIGDRTVQPQDRDVADRDFEPLRFFFTVDPATLPGYPAVDVLQLGGASVPAADQVRQVRVYRRRANAGTSAAEQNLGGIQAVALRSDSPQRAGPFAWELLTEGRDYYLDPSGVWFALASRLDERDYLAVSYVTAADDTVGTFPSQAQAGVTDTLVLIHEPQRGADAPTFRYEMRNAYRVGSVDDVVRESAQLRVLVAEAERPDSASATFLALLGVAQGSNPNVFDQFSRLFPRQQDPGRGAPLHDFYVVFPHLTPFAGAQLPAQFRTDSLYKTPTYLLRTQGPAPLYSLRLHYDAAGGADRRVLALGAFQIREGSERISIGGRQLDRGSDYTMNYEVGQVTFLNPDSLFQQPTTVTVQYEENPAFAIAPTSIYGLHARYDLGDHGTLGMVGLFQRQRTTYTRPPLGFEPQSNMIGGLTGNLRFEPMGITRVLDALPLLRTSARSSLTLDAEIATSRPSPNQLGVAYVETFEDEGGTFLPLGEDAWEYGSRPAFSAALAGTGISGAGFADQDASLMVWQNFWASGGQQVQFRAREIDPAIRLIGAGESFETILWLTLQPDTIGGLWNPDTVNFAPRWFLPHTPGPRWRSISEPLSSSGVDLSRIEYLEFWLYEDSTRAARTQGTSVVFDFGTVFEDAVAFQPTGFHVANGRDTTYVGRRRAGAGRLDTERDTLTNSFNAGINDTGILGDVADSIRNLDADTVVRNLALCTSELGAHLVVYPLGVDLAHCTRRNGRSDTEDLNGDQHLDSLIVGTGENHFRYVFRMNDDRYFVREGGHTAGGATWRLYRIPFRAAADTIGLPDIRQIRALRMTVIVPDNGTPERPIVLGVARLKLVGAPWVKRAATPIAGLAGSAGQGHGEVVASVVSTEDTLNLGYTPPPGVTDLGSSRTGNFQVGATQINERSLRLLGVGVQQGERAEAFVRFPDGERNFLGYRQLRVWARGRGAGWDNRQLAFYVKVAQDENNFYLYRQNVSTTTWEPEAVVAFGQWLALRAQIEQAFLRGDPPSGAAACGGDPLAYVRCDAARQYIVQVRNPGVAPPNLTRVQELAVGLVRDSGNAADSAELWVDDIRLTGVVDDPGYAGAVTARLVAADVADMDLSLVRRDRNFRQLGETPSYETTNQLAMGATVRLERFGLERYGISLPFTIRADRSSTDPFFLNRTDVEASGLDGLRSPEANRTSYAFTMRRTRIGTRWWQRAVTDNIIVSGSWSSDAATTALSRSTGRTSDFRADYQVQPAGHAVSYVPGFLRNLLNGLPGFLRETDMVRGLRGGKLRWTPAVFAFGAELARTQSESRSFRAPIVLAADSAVAPTQLLQATLRQRATVELRPFSAASFGATLTSDRDLRDYGDSTTIGRVADQSRRSFLGADVGFERTRVVATRLNYSPSVVSWVRPRWSASSTFSLARDPNRTTPERGLGDSAGAFRLPTSFSAVRSSEIGGSLDFSRPLRALLGDSSLLRRVLDRISQLDMSRRSEHRSQFSLPGFDPGLGFQAGLSGASSFRSQHGVSASAATDLREDRLAMALRMPAGLGLTAAYSSAVNAQYARRGETQQLVRSTDTDWPNLTARWLWSPRSSFARKLIASVNASYGVRRRLSESVMPTLGSEAEVEAGAVRTSALTDSKPFSVGVTWANRVSTSLSVSHERSRAERTGNITVSDRNQMSANATFAFRVPPEIIPLRGAVRSALRYTSSDASTCIAGAGLAGCLAVAESKREEYSVLLDTDVPPNVSAGLSASYVLTEDVHANRKFSQFVLTATVRVVFQAGELR